MHRKMLSIRVFVILGLTLLFASFAGVQAQNLSPEEIISRHIESLGKPDDIAKTKLRVAVGGSEFVIRSTSRRAKGVVYLASNGADMKLLSTFDMRDYPNERIGLFSNKINVPTIENGQRGPLGKFLNSYDRILNERLFGGCVFSTWLFLSPDAPKGRLETVGKKKLGDRDVWVVKYSPKGGLTTGSYIKLYFDAENFHHLRTEFRQKETEQGFHDTGSKANPQNPANWDADMAANGSKITEDFSDYRIDGSLMLPHKYTILLEIDSYNGTALFDYFFTINEYKLFKEFPANIFTFQTAANKTN